MTYIEQHVVGSGLIALTGTAFVIFPAQTRGHNPRDLDPRTVPARGEQRPLAPDRPRHDHGRSGPGHQGYGPDDVLCLKRVFWQGILFTSVLFVTVLGLVMGVVLTMQDPSIGQSFLTLFKDAVMEGLRATLRPPFCKDIPEQPPGLPPALSRGGFLRGRYPVYPFDERPDHRFDHRD